MPVTWSPALVTVQPRQGDRGVPQWWLWTPAVPQWWPWTPAVPQVGKRGGVPGAALRVDPDKRNFKPPIKPPHLSSSFGMKHHLLKVWAFVSAIFQANQAASVHSSYSWFFSWCRARWHAPQGAELGRRMHIPKKRLAIQAKVGLHRCFPNPRVPLSAKSYWLL
jgi:hypothetical protein